ncbi:MAG: hypothetical protein MUF66_03710 [Gammaproteobacteria bacterium]|jgi:sensor c-di-GMP phosphodiesterase-like protein|nr:hypothetical protein [Gammaproteobacteria bacterium]
MRKRLLAVGAGALALVVGPGVAFGVAGFESASPAPVPADTSQASVQQAYLTALTNQINPIATALASANASTIINFHQYRINSPGSDTVIAFTIGGTAISVAQNINSSNQGVAQINEQSALQLKYQEIVNVAQNAAAGG